MSPPLPRNNQWRWVRLSLAVAATSLTAMLLPILGYVGIFEGGGAVLLIGLWLGVSGLVLAAMFRGRARAHDAIVAGPRHLARWQYGRDAWTLYAETDLATDLAAKWGLWRFVALVAAGIGLAFALADREAGPAVAVVLGGSGRAAGPGD